MMLNSVQQTAVHHTNGPLLIVAGAGTGKTTVITERIKYLIQDKKIDPYHIFAATFTEKAAEEMRSRLDAVMPFGYLEPWLGTFHGLCQRLLQTEGLEIGINPNFKIMTQTDQWMFIREHLYEFNLEYYRPLGNPSKYISSLIKFFSRLADETITPETLMQHAATEADETEAKRLMELGAVCQQYQQLKYKHAVLDFGDLINQSLRLFRERSNIREKYQKQFQYMLIDEFQDTNYAQFELIKLLAPPESNPNLTVVGDDDQSIYKFRGASISNILAFKDVYPKAKEIVLSENYRSGQPILDVAYQSIQQNNPDRLEATLHINKKLTAQPKTDAQPVVLQYDTIEDEVNGTVQQIIQLITKENLSYKDIAIITRSNGQLEPYANVLKAVGIPYQLVANRGLYDQEEIGDLLTFLKVLIDPSDGLSLFQLSQNTVFGCDSKHMLELLKLAKAKSTSLWEELDHPKLRQLIESFQAKIGTHTVSKLLYEFIDTTGYVKQFTDTDSIENQLKIKNLNLFFNQLKRFESTAVDKSVMSFLNTYESWTEAGENPGQSQIEDIDTVSLMTIHASKGLEFAAVFVGSLVAGRFPSNNRKEFLEIPDALIKESLPTGDEHLEEERRLFYVAVTRAKRWLYLTFAEDVGGARKRKVSGFVKETGLPIQVMKHDQQQITFHTSLAVPEPRYLKEGKYIIDTVSYSQIDTFDMCPLKYKYRYLLQIPAPPHHSLSFGRTIHQTLFTFHSLEQQGKTPSEAELLSLYQDNFIEEGYEDSTHKQQNFDAGLIAMKDYFKGYKQIFGKPILLEQSFRLKLPTATLVGKIDRIDQDNDGQYEIIDYKTGSHKDQKKVDKDEQLTIYALAAKEALNIPTSRMSLYFLRRTDEGKPPEKITTTRTEDQLAKAKLKLIDRVASMQTSTFPAKPDPVTCGFCEYYSLCPFASKKK